MLARPQYFAAVLFDVIGRLGFDALAERIIHREKIPVLSATPHHRRCRGVAGRPSVIDPLDRVGRAGLSGQIRAGRGRCEEGHFCVANERIDSETDGRIRHVDNGIDRIDIEPFARDCRADIGLVLVIGVDDLHFDILAATVEIFRGHPRRLYRAHAVGVLENPGYVVEYADPHHIAGNFSMRRPTRGQGQRKRQASS